MAKEENLRYGQLAGDKESIHYIGKDKGHKNIPEEAYAGNCVPQLSDETGPKAAAIDKKRKKKKKLKAQGQEKISYNS